ncbi:MAG: ABC transporter ATP-binding protein/permease [Ruminococcaceae bacterium]|nr:ABC transporter ATP-binding protein/permease [Oscillospiraceae bacterium]
MIRIQGLHKYFNKGKQNEIHVINDITLELPEKGMTAIFGKSGCGKTTLLNVIGGLDSFASGTLTVEGKDIRTDTDDLRNRYIGYIFQNYNLHKDRTCFENVADALLLCGMKDENEIERRVMKALENVGMDKYAKRTPDTLSGGQQQRIAIARAIVKNPRIILADEPTGNLDELNTVMIMDLLKSIAKDHLVLLVTHEADLVDHYCDTVIELSDGKIVGMKNNSDANGYTAKNKNHIYLGELEKKEISTPFAEIEYFGESPEVPIRLRIVNHGGKLYAEFENDTIHILDTSAEVKLYEGVYEKEKEAEQKLAKIEMEDLPPVEASATGKLFSLASSLKSGYDMNFKKGKKGKKVLRACMCLFAAVIVFMFAVFGTSIQAILEAKDSYNHNMFYLYTPDGEVSDKLIAAMKNGEGGFDFMTLRLGYPSLGDREISFRMQSFETFSPSYAENFSARATLLDRFLASGKKLLVGKADGLAKEEILITSKVADALLEASPYGHISEYKHLIGITSAHMSVDGKALRIAGIVESEETSVYCDAMALAEYMNLDLGLDAVKPASEFGLSVAPGETMLALKYGELENIPTLGEKVLLRGEQFLLSSVLRGDYHYYGMWLDGNGIQKLNPDEYFLHIVKTEYPELTEGTAEFQAKCSELSDLRYAEYYDYYYAEVKDFMKDRYRFYPDTFELWLYYEKGLEEMYYLYVDENYYLVKQYEQRYGKTPSLSELEEKRSEFQRLDMLPYYELYEEEFYRTDFGAQRLSGTTYLVSDEDYIMLSKRMGESHESLPEYRDYLIYTAIHSVNPEETEAFLMENFSHLENGYDFLHTILTPDLVFESIVEDQMETITGGLIAIVVILAVMSVCMYFIMRSSLMSRIKEVGIYRAIGVSKKNLVFKFLTEAFVLASLTVLFGYLATSAFLFACMSVSDLVSSVFYYPIWMAGLVLALLYALSLICGTIPILSLLRKTPSEILAKYDI